MRMLEFPNEVKRILLNAGENGLYLLTRVDNNDGWAPYIEMEPVSDDEFMKALELVLKGVID